MGIPPLRRTEDTFEGRDGLALFRRAWLPPEPERVVAVVHGFAEHAGRYESFGSWFAARSCAVHAYDHRGHGRSEGTRRHVRHLDEYLDDLELFLERVSAEHAGLPVFLVGHSMGGLIAASYACERTVRAAAVVTSGAALRLPELGRLRLSALRALGRALPRLRIDAGLDPDGLSRDPEVVRRYREDPFVDTDMTLAHGAALFDAIERTAAGAERVRTPMLVLHGGDDPICLAEGSRAFHAALRAPGSALQVYERLRHEIFNEPEREQVYGDVLAWIQEREGEDAL